MRLNQLHYFFFILVVFILACVSFTAFSGEDNTIMPGMIFRNIGDASNEADHIVISTYGGIRNSVNEDIYVYGPIPRQHTSGGTTTIQARVDVFKSTVDSDFFCTLFNYDRVGLSWQYDTDTISGDSSSDNYTLYPTIDDAYDGGYVSLYCKLPASYIHDT